MNKLSALLLMLGIVHCAISQIHIDTTDYKQAEQFIGTNISKKYYRSWVNPQWAEGAPVLWYTIKTHKGLEYMSYNLKTSKKQKLFDPIKLGRLLSDTSKQVMVHPYKLPIHSVKLMNKGQTLVFKKGKEWYQYQIENNQLSKYKTSPSAGQLSIFSPDSSQIALVKNYNIWIKTNGDSVQITKDGTPAFGHGVSPSWYSTKNIEQQNDHPLETNMSWSPNGKYIIAGKYDRRQAKNLYLYQALPKEGHRAVVKEYERPIAGDSIVPTVEYELIDTQTKTSKLLRLKPKATFLTYGFHWLKDGSKAYQVSFNRGYQSVEINEVNTATGTTRQIFTESSKTYVDPNTFDFKLLEKSNAFLWLSEQDGWNHIYLHSLEDGNTINQVTKGDFVVREVKYVDEKAKKIYFTAGGKEANCDPYYPLLYVVNYNGKGLRLLTPEKAHHTIFFSNDHKYFVDNYSTIQKPNIALLRRTQDGKIIKKLEEGDVSELKKMGWQAPEPFVVKGRDGQTDIYGVLFKPANFDPNKKYPIIEGTYSGPQTIRAPKTFYRGLINDDMPLSQLGFVMVNIDGMGSAFRSKAFHDVSYKNLGDIGGPDKMKAITTLAQKHPWIDSTRVGIFGHSAGGYDAARALLAYPEFYKVGVATAGNHDHRSAKAWWPELYMGYPVGKHYDEQSNYLNAKNLRGNLLLVHGDQDQNVNPTASMRLAAELIKANKDFELLLIPNKDHSQVYYDSYLIRKRWDFFVKHLHGIVPPKEYQIGKVK